MEDSDGTALLGLAFCAQAALGQTAGPADSKLIERGRYLIILKQSGFHDLSWWTCGRSSPAATAPKALST
jgi:hypothetical protein